MQFLDRFSKEEIAVIMKFMKEFNEHLEIQIEHYTTEGQA